MSDFWARKIGGLTQPPPQAPAPQQAGTWWQPAQPQQAQPQYPQQYPQQGYNPALQAQMPNQQPHQPGQVDQQLINQLKRIPTEQLNQDQMELIAQWELTNDQKYNQLCPQCGSGNYAPQGTVIGNKRLGADKCFDCGASSSTYTSSPEPALGGSKTSKAPYRDVRQIDTGGYGGQSMYLKLNGVPRDYMPRGG